MNDTDLENNLMQETSTRTMLRIVEKESTRLETSLISKKKATPLPAKLFSFIKPIGQQHKTAITETQKELTRSRNKADELRLKLAKIQSELDSAIISKMESESNAIYERSKKLFGFYDLSRDLISDFKTQVLDFRSALGAARSAMSSSYVQKSKEYTSAAKDRIAEAISKNDQMNQANQSLRSLDREYKYISRGTMYARVELPKFPEIDHTTRINALIDLSIADAQKEFDELIAICDKLKDEEIDEALANVASLEDEHKKINQDFIRKTWEQLQTKLLNDKV